ncbi:MAG: restriction endonuclease subunit S, partial [Clostridium sp.]
RKLELKLLDELIRARFVEMFGDIRYEEKYQGIPLRRLCTTISGGTPSTKCSEYYEGNIPWISTVSLGPNYIDGSTAKGYITQEAIDNSATKLIPAGNILFGTRVGVGKSSINDVALCINQDIVAIVGIDKNRFNVLFIKYVLDTYQSYYDSIKKGATILGITGDDLKNTLIPVPSLELQNQFADFVKVVDKSKFTKTFRPL